MTLLLAGGASDPNLGALMRTAMACGVTVQPLLSAPGQGPRLAFDPHSGALLLEGRAMAPPRAAFLRADVFGGNPATAPGRRYRQGEAAVQGILRGWLAAQPGIARFNADPFGRSRSVNKLAALAAAARIGLAVPETLAGNDAAALAARLETGALVQKPVAGGEYCRPLAVPDLDRHQGDLPAVIAQARLAPPELRVFRAGAALLGFDVASAALDYRQDRATVVRPRTVPQELQAPLLALTDAMGLDWCASDFKTCPQTGRLLYLETNANPMFAAFDRAAEGALCRQMLRAMGLVD